MEYFLFLFLSAVTIFLRLSGSLVYFCWLLLAVMWSEWFSVRRICFGNLHVETLDGPYLMRAPLEGTCLCAWQPPWALLTHDHLKTKPWVWVFIGFITRIARRSHSTQRWYEFLPLAQRKAGLWPLNFISGKKKITLAFYSDTRARIPSFPHPVFSRGQIPSQQVLLCRLQVSQACSTNLWPARTGMYSLTVLGPRHLTSTWQASVSLRRSTPIFSILCWSHILHVWYSSILLGSASIFKWHPWPPSPCLFLCPLLFVEEHQSLDFPPSTKSRIMILDIVAWYLQRVFSSKVTFLVSPWDVNVEGCSPIHYIFPHTSAMPCDRVSGSSYDLHPSYVTVFQQCDVAHYRTGRTL